VANLRLFLGNLFVICIVETVRLLALPSLNITMFPFWSRNESVNILLVDDDPDIRFLLKLVLQKEGFNVFFAENGRQALDLCHRNAIDLILLDVVMPLLNGFEICRQIRIFSSIPVIFLTAMDDEQDVVKGFEVGGYDYILKPFRLKELVARIYSVLRRSLPQMTYPESLPMSVSA
jgi:DNA-binding response OmpR family regulator